jgi:hypothetical protein
MAIAALVTWLITAGFGFFMLIRWATRGGLREVPGAGTNFPRVRVFAHFGLAAAGLIVWIIYLVTGNTLWAWIAVADLILVALLGGLLVRQWTKDGRAAMASAARPDAGAAPSAPGAVDLAEQHIPRPPVVLHGVFAVSTVILVLLSAFGVGGG